MASVGTSLALENLDVSIPLIAASALAHKSESRFHQLPRFGGGSSDLLAVVEASVAKWPHAQPFVLVKGCEEPSEQQPSACRERQSAADKYWFWRLGAFVPPTHHRSNDSQSLAGNAAAPNSPPRWMLTASQSELRRECCFLRLQRALTSSEQFEEPWQPRRRLQPTLDGCQMPSYDVMS